MRGGIADGGSRPTRVSKTGRSLAPAASGTVFSNSERTWGSGLNAAGIVSSEFADPHRSRNEDGCRTAPGHCGGCVPPCRYAMGSSAGLTYA